mgnify:CR=1 FL=1
MEEEDDAVLGRADLDDRVREARRQRPATGRVGNAGDDVPGPHLGPGLDGGVDGLAAYRRIVGEAARVVTPGGALVCEVGAGQAPAVAALFAAAGFFAVDRVADLAGIERVVGGTAVPAAAVQVASS